MTTSRFADQLNAQIGNEFAAHTAVRRCGRALRRADDAADGRRSSTSGPRGARPRDDDGPLPPRHRGRGRDPAVEAPQSRFDGVTEPIELALAQERAVTEQIYTLTRIAREENDFAAEQFMQWFIKEQVEEVATMQDLLAVVGRSKDDINDIETYVERELGGSASDATAPPVADA
jgi:hypothetical protein